MSNSNPLLSAHCFRNNRSHSSVPTQLNGSVWSKIETAVKPFKTFDTDTVTGSFNDSGVIGVEATLSTAYLDSNQRDYACTSFYALGGGSLPLSLPKALQDYASPTPYVFTGDLTLTFKDSDLANVSSVPISPLTTVNDSVNSILDPNITFGSFTFDTLLVVSSSRDSNCKIERYGAVGYSFDNTLTFCLLKPDYSLVRTFEVDISTTIGFIDTFYNLTTCSLVWLTHKSCVFGIRGQNTIYLINIGDDNTTINITPFTGDEILYISESKEFIFGNPSILISRYDAVLGFNIYSISDFGEQLLYVGDGVFVGFYKTSDFVAIATKDLLNNSVSIKVLQDWISPCSLITSSDLTADLGVNWFSEGAVVYEGVVYFLLRSSATKIVLLRVSDGYVLKSPAWVEVGSNVGVIKIFAGASGIVVITTEAILIIRYENDGRLSVLLSENFSNSNPTGAFVFNGIAYFTYGLNARALNSFNAITTQTYFRCIRNIQQAPFATDYTNIISPNNDYIVLVYTSLNYYYSFDLTEYAGGHTFTAFSGFIRRGDKLYGVFLLRKAWNYDGSGSLSNIPLIVEASQLTEDTVTGLNLDSAVIWGQSFGFDSQFNTYILNAVAFTESKFRAILTLLDLSNNTYIVLGYDNTYLGHSRQWLNDRLNYSKSAALVAGDKYAVERFTSFDLPILGLYTDGTSNTVFEHFIPCIDSQTISLHSDLTVDETQFEGKWTNTENAGERSLSSLSPRLNILANQSMFLGIVNVYDTLTPNVLFTENVTPPVTCPLDVLVAGDGSGGSLFVSDGFYSGSGLKWSGYAYRTGGGGTLYSPQSSIVAVLGHTGSNFDHVEFAYIWEANYRSNGLIPSLEVETSNFGGGNYDNISVSIHAFARQQGIYLYLGDSVPHTSGLNVLFTLPTTNMQPWYDTSGSTHSQAFDNNAETEWGFIITMDGGSGSHNLGQLLINSLRLQNSNRCMPVNRNVPLGFVSTGYSCPAGADFVFSSGSEPGDLLQFSSDGGTTWTTVFVLTTAGETYLSPPVPFFNSGLYRFIRLGVPVPLDRQTGQTTFSTSRYDCNGGGGGAD